MLAKVLKICHIERHANQVEMSDAIITLVNIIDRVLDTYNTNEGWVVKKMRLKYALCVQYLFMEHESFILSTNFL